MINIKGAMLLLGEELRSVFDIVNRSHIKSFIIKKIPYYNINMNPWSHLIYSLSATIWIVDIIVNDKQKLKNNTGIIGDDIRILGRNFGKFWKE